MLCCPKDTLEGDAAVLFLGRSLLFIFLPRHLAHEVLRLRKRVISFTDSFGLGQVSMVTVRGDERACPHFPNSWNRQGGTAIQQWWSLAFRLEPAGFAVKVALGCHFAFLAWMPSTVRLR